MLCDWTVAYMLPEQHMAAVCMVVPMFTGADPKCVNLVCSFLLTACGPHCI
jgi:hypothetical protein